MALPEIASCESRMGGQGEAGGGNTQVLLLFATCCHLLSRASCMPAHSQASTPPVFGHYSMQNSCLQSKTGGVEGLGTRLGIRL